MVAELAHVGLAKHAEACQLKKWYGYFN